MKNSKVLKSIRRGVFIQAESLCIVGGNALHVGRHRSKGKERGQASCLSFSTDILGKADVHFLNGKKKNKDNCA